MSEWPYGMKVRPIQTWPGVSTANRGRSQFSAGVGATTNQLRYETDVLDATNVVLQLALTEQDLRIDGAPRANAKVSHPGVILSMDTPKGPLSFPCDTFVTWQENLRAIALTMEKLRAIKRYGVAQHDEQYSGWRAIESGARAMPGGFATLDEAMRFILKVTGDPTTIQPDTNWRALVSVAKRRTHPDRGGDADDFQRVMLAEEVLRSEGYL